MPNLLEYYWLRTQMLLLLTLKRLLLDRKDSTKFIVEAPPQASLPIASIDLEADDDDAVVALEDSSEELEPAWKRARLESHASAGPSNALQQSPSAMATSSGRGDEQAWIPPFSLLKVQGIPSYGNRSECLSSF